MSPLTCAFLCAFTDVSSGSELCQRGGDQAFPWSPDGAAGEETEEKRYLLACCRLTEENDMIPFNLVLKMKRASSYPTFYFRLVLFSTSGVSIMELLLTRSN